MAPALMLPSTAMARVSIGINIGIAPPALPVYAQPLAPGAGYIWTPGYWAWNGAGYYWVPGSWVMPPAIGLLWTPGWWGWSGGFYNWHPGYWGRHVGFYGGINYGFGYFGNGYSGGYWRGRDFHYNRAVNNINVTRIRNVYVDRTVINNRQVNRVSYNGGRGGVDMRPTAQQRSYDTQRRWSATSKQTLQREQAQRNPGQRYQDNRARPAVYATQHAGRLDAPRNQAVPQARARQGATPERAGGMVTAPRPRTQTVPGSGRGFVEAPHDRAGSGNAGRRGFVEAPRGQAAPATQRGNGFVEAPRRDLQQMPVRGPATRNERPQPANARQESFNAGRERGQRAQPERGPRAQSERGRQEQHHNNGDDRGHDRQH